MKRWMLNILLAFDQFFNALFGGDPDETLSSRMGKSIRDGHCPLCDWVCRFLNWIDSGHCKKAIDESEGRDEVYK